MATSHFGSSHFGSKTGSKGKGEIVLINSEFYSDSTLAPSNQNKDWHFTSKTVSGILP